MGFKRRLAEAFGQLTGTVVVPQWETHQLPEREHLRRFFDHFAVDCVFDVGANEGQTAEKLRGAIGYSGHIVSFEPIPELAELLRRKSSRDPKWHIVEAVLDRTAGASKFNIMRQSTFSSLHTPLADQPQAIGDMNEVARVVEVRRAPRLPRSSRGGVSNWASSGHS